MAVIRFLKEVLRYVQALIDKKTYLRDDEFAAITEAANRLIFLLYGAKDRKSRDDMAKVRGIKESITQMLHTEDPDVFSLKYADAVSFAEELGESEYADERIKSAVDEIHGMLLDLRKSPKRPSSNGLTYYSVTFRNKRRSYYYISDGKAYSVGQHVLVPAGEDMQIRVVRVVGVDTFRADNVPMPVEDVKTIEGPAIY